MLTCFVLEQQENVAELVNLIVQCPYIKLIGTSSNFDGAIELLKRLDPDILYLDSCYTKCLKKKSLRAKLIITSYASQEAFMAFENNAFDFLLKPIEANRFHTSVDKLRALFEFEEQREINKNNSDFFFVKKDSKGNRIAKLFLSDIIYIEAIQNYINIHTEKENHILYFTMTEILEHLPLDKFCRIHKSYIVNLHKITGIDGNIITLEAEKKIMTGPTYRSAFFSILNKLFLKSKRPVLKVLINQNWIELN